MPANVPESAAWLSLVMGALWDPLVVPLLVQDQLSSWQVGWVGGGGGGGVVWGGGQHSRF